MIVVLDTNAYSDWCRFGRWNHVISTAEKVLMPSTVIGELWAGFLMGDQFQRNAQQLEKFLAEPCVEVIPIRLSTAKRYAEFVLQLKTAGTPIPTNDIWIAAQCFESQGLLVTADLHFQNLPQIARAVEPTNS